MATTNFITFEFEEAEKQALESSSIQRPPHKQRVPRNGAKSDVAKPNQNEPSTSKLIPQYKAKRRKQLQLKKKIGATANNQAVDQQNGSSIHGSVSPPLDVTEPEQDFLLNNDTDFSGDLYRSSSPILVKVPSVSAQGMVLDTVLDSPSIRAVRAQESREANPFTTEQSDFEANFSWLQQKSGSESVRAKVHEMEVFKSITIREQFLLQLRRLVWTINESYNRLQYLVRQRCRLRKESKSDQLKLRQKLTYLQKDLSILLVQIRNVSIQTTDHILRWRDCLVEDDAANMQSAPKFHTFKWQDQNYLIKMRHDLLWLRDHESVSCWIGFSLDDNPMLILPEGLDVKAMVLAQKEKLLEERAEQHRLEIEEQHRQFVLQIRQRMANANISQPGASERKVGKQSESQENDQKDISPPEDAKEGVDTNGRVDTNGKVNTKVEEGDETATYDEDHGSESDEDEDEEEVVDGLLMTMALPDVQLIQPLSAAELARAQEATERLSKEMALEDQWKKRELDEQKRLARQYDPFAEIIRTGGIQETFDSMIRRRSTESQAKIDILRERQQNQDRASVIPSAQPSAGQEDASKDDEAQVGTTFITATKDVPVPRSGKQHCLRVDKRKMRVQMARRGSNGGGGCTFIRQQKTASVNGVVLSYKPRRRTSLEDQINEERVRVSAATEIQKLYRGHQGRQVVQIEQRERREIAITRMQRMYRGHQARAIVRCEKAMVHARRVEIGAAVSIQATYRGHVGRHEAHLERAYQETKDAENLRRIGYERRRFKEKRDLEQAELRARRRAREQLEMKLGGAATTIQTSFRRHRCEQASEVMRAERRVAAATLIQSSARASSARSQVNQVRWEKQREHAALSVQTTFRMYAGKKAVTNRRLEIIAALRSDAENAGIAATETAQVAQQIAYQANVEAEEAAAAYTLLPPVKHTSNINPARLEKKKPLQLKKSERLPNITGTPHHEGKARKGEKMRKSSKQELRMKQGLLDANF